MRKIQILTILAAILLSSCEFRKFEFTIYPTYIESTTADTKANFDFVGEITADDILEITELDPGIEITELEIVSIQLIVTPLEGNEVDEISITANFINSNLQVIPLLNPNPTNATLNNTPGEQNIFSDLNSIAVGELKSKINQFITGANYQPFGIAIQGVSLDPTKDDIKLDLELRVEIGISYTDCIEVPVGLGGEEC